MTSACPYCFEEVQPGARKCRHCGEFLDPKLRREAAARGKRNFPHLLHFCISVVTLGIWLPLWFLAFAIRNRRVFY